MPCVILHWIERPSWVLSCSSNTSVYDLLIDYHSELYGLCFITFRLANDFSQFSLNKIASKYLKITFSNKRTI